MGNVIRQARDARGWTSAQLNHAVRRAAAEIGVSTASPDSLRIMISRWENDKETPDSKYRLLLQKALGLSARAFEDDDDEGLGGLAVPTFGRVDISDAVLSYFRQQLTINTDLDNVTGPAFVIATVSAQVEQLRRLAERGPAEVIQLAARYSEAAGWLHQDSGDLKRALQHTDESVDLAESAGDIALAGYNLMRKSNVLTSLGFHQRAAATAYRAVGMARNDTPDLLPVCLRQVALAEAHLGREESARAALDEALELAPQRPDERDSAALSSYCTTSYLEMEGALCLLVLDSPTAAEAACLRALSSWPEGLVRDEGLCLTRLAVAYLDQLEVDDACHVALQAVQRVAQAPSARAVHMLQLIGRRVAPFKDARSVRQLREALATVA